MECATRKDDNAPPSRIIEIEGQEAPLKERRHCACK